MKRLLLIVGLLFACVGSAQAQSTAGVSVQGVIINRSTVNSAAVITTGGTFQQILPSIIGSATAVRQALTIENNNASDNCWIYIGASGQTEAKSILLLPGGSYVRYWPFVPSDEIQATCANNSDTLYVDSQ